MIWFILYVLILVYSILVLYFRLLFEASEPPVMSTEVTGVTYTIGGVKVNFPAKAYPSQVSMMDKIIRGCARAQNCLLESPTGSGKTLALLCGALAWQKAEKQRLNEEYAVAKQEYDRKNKEMELQKLQCLENVQKTVCGDEKTSDSVMEVCDSSVVEVVEVFDLSDSEDGDIFRPVTKKGRLEEVVVPSKSSKPNPPPANKSKNEIVDKNENCDQEKNPPPKKVNPPKIYFCTRTHKQIAQVVKELRRTAYNDINSTILSSRTHSCIHERGENPKINKTDLCHQLIDPRRGLSCRFQRNVRNFCSFDVLRGNSFSSLWDLEDLIAFGKKRTVCPYYTARELMSNADIVFCPYNYLIDPLIRNSMRITLRGDVVIVDEAHNIEDSCREAASFTLVQDSITDSIQELEELMKNLKNDPKEECCAAIINVLCSVSSWIDKHRSFITSLSDYDLGNYTMLGPQAVDSFKDYAFAPEKFEYFATNYAMLTTEEKTPAMEEFSNMVDVDISTVTGSTKALLEGLLLILSLLYNPKYTHDYHIVLTKTFCHQYNEAPEPDNDGWFNRRRKPKTISKWRYTVNFWCFNPAATFSTIEENARCIVLSSGTLSPMNSFQSELGSKFPITLEANHVIDSSQCWIASIGRGPNNVSLDGKFANTSTYQFQDEIGNILLRICSLVPHGVLCFVPSYSLLEKLYERWSCTNVLDNIKKYKLVLCEPRKGDELDNLLKTFYETIEDTAANEVGRELNGVLLLAVCRGKVSEGLDFADNNARVVVTIGIPYPSIKDNQVMLKKSYNDKHKHSKGLLSGQEWYEIQAYRALNQALGRCIRHRKDWGGILLIDNRFMNSNYYRCLSKWVRNKVSHYHNYNEMIDSLSIFIENRLKIDKESG